MCIALAVDFRFYVKYSAAVLPFAEPLNTDSCAVRDFISRSIISFSLIISAAITLSGWSGRGIVGEEMWRLVCLLAKDIQQIIKSVAVKGADGNYRDKVVPHFEKVNDCENLSLVFKSINLLITKCGNLPAS